MLNLDRLRALHAVSAQGSINAAAETLNVTTSAVSQQLAKLELETGQQLLERHGRGVRLTDAATQLVGRTQSSKRATMRWPGRSRSPRLRRRRAGWRPRRCATCARATRSWRSPFTSRSRTNPFHAWSAATST